jgi:hypothetical protein
LNKIHIHELLDLLPLFNKTNKAKCKAAVPFTTAIQYLALQKDVIASSNSLTFGLVVRKYDF